MSKLVRRSRWSVMALVVVLAACSGGDDGDGDASTDGSVPGATTATSEPDSTDPDSTDPDSTEPESTDPATTDAVTTAPAVTTTPPTTAAPDTGECLVGDWVVTADQMNAYYAGLMTTVDAPIGILATGSAPLSFRGDGTYGWAPAFELAVDVAGQAGTGLTGGTIEGSWTAADGVITTASEVNALTIEITVNSTTFSGSDLANGLLNDSPINGVTYSCAGPAPVIDFQTLDPAVTVPVTLTPA